MLQLCRWCICFTYTLNIEFFLYMQECTIEQFDENQTNIAIFNACLISLNDL